MTVGDRIRSAREKLGVSQEELAKRLKLKDKSSVCKIEKAGDNISTKSIKKYADALGVSPSFLMGWEQTAIGPRDEYAIELDRMNIQIMEEEEAALGTSGFALKIALYRMTKQELQNLYDVAKIMYPHAFIEKE